MHILIISGFGLISTDILTNLKKSAFGAKLFLSFNQKLYSSYRIKSSNLSDLNSNRQFREWLGGFIDGFGTFSKTYTYGGINKLHISFKLKVVNKHLLIKLQNIYGGSLLTIYKCNGSGDTIYEITEAKYIKSFLYDINGFLRKPISIENFNDMCYKFKIKSLYLNKSFKQEPLSFKNAWLAGLVDSQSSKHIIKLNSHTWELYWILTVFNWGNYSLLSVNGLSKYGGEIINNTINFSDKFHKKEILNLKFYFDRYSLDSNLHEKMSLISEILDSKRILHYNNPCTTKGYLAVLKLNELSKKI